MQVVETKKRARLRMLSLEVLGVLLGGVKAGKAGGRRVTSP